MFAYETQQARSRELQQEAEAWRLAQQARAARTAERRGTRRSAARAAVRTDAEVPDSAPRGVVARIAAAVHTPPRSAA